MSADELEARFLRAVRVLSGKEAWHELLSICRDAIDRVRELEEKVERHTDNSSR